MNRYKKAILTILTGLLMLTEAEAFSGEIEEKTALSGLYLTSTLANETRLDQTLIVLDIDDTILASPTGQWLGASVMFYGLMKETLERNPDWSKRQAADYLDPLLVHLYRRIPLDLVDSTLPEVIDTLKKRGARVIGMTSRGIVTKEVTLWQLSQFGVTFTDTGSQRDILLPEARTSLIEHGVVFTGHGNRKGEVLDFLLKEGQTTLSNIFSNIHRIIMIDDQVRHLVDVGNTLTEQTFTPVLCTYPATQPEYNHKEAVLQLRQFLKLWKDRDKVISEMIENDPFTKTMVDE